LDLPWVSWNASAQELGVDFTLWLKSDYKSWISNYVDYYNALNEFQVNDTSNFTALNFSAIWTYDFDVMSCSLDYILSALNQSSTIVGDTQNWFVNFFGPQGVVTLNMTQDTSVDEDSQSSEGVVNITTSGGAVVPVVNVPSGMEQIVAWITQ